MAQTSNLALPIAAKFHFMIGYLRQAGKAGPGISAVQCLLLADKLEEASSVAALQAELRKALEGEA